MFDDFKDGQFVSYSLLCNSVRNNKLSHAYLIDGNNNEYAFDFVMAFVKMIICDKHYSNFDKCANCNKCNRIDDGNYTEVKIIESDSLIIKKEQLLELQSDFSRTSIEGNNRVYIIKDCEKMNKQAANSLLKFLEEPEDGIIAILFTNNINKVLGTIISRCQLIKLSKDNFINRDKALINLANFCCNSKDDIDKFLKDESKERYVVNVIEFINYYEENGLDAIIYLKKIWYNIFSTREDNIYALILMVNFYYDVLKFKYEISDYFFADYLDLVNKVSNNNNINKIMKKIEICIEKYEMLKCNLNINLLIDDMIIRLGE